ncbi:MAG: M23 family metallopeptidase [Candidatus Zixiibacteriota bacterium]
MWKKRIRFSIHSESAGNETGLREISLPVPVVFAAAGALGVMVLVTGFSVFGIISARLAHIELQTLRAETTELSDKYDELRSDMAEVENRYQDLVQKEMTIRSIFGLPEIEVENRGLGIGGPAPLAVDSLNEGDRIAIETELSVDRLLKLADFEKEKFTEIESALLKRKERVDHTPSIWPTRGHLSRGYGMHHDPFTGVKQMHRGLDIANRIGTPILATANGKVVGVTFEGGHGKYITIDHGYGYSSRYAHLSEFRVKVGQQVKRGQVIGLMGSTGYSTGPHLHYEVMKSGQEINPMDFIVNTRDLPFSKLVQ